MGFSLSWIAVKGKPTKAVCDEFGFRPSGEREEIPEADLSAAEMPSGWYLIVSNHSERIGTDAALQRLSSSGCEIVTCFVEEHVMVSKATGWKDGQMIWSVTHDAQKGQQHLEVKGEPPPEFAAIRDGLLAKKTPDTCDYIFDIPVEIARSVTSYRYDQDVPGLSGKAFEVLVDGAPKKASFFKRLFGA